MSVGSNQSVFLVEAAKMVAKQFLSVVILGLAVCQVSGSTIKDAELALKQLDDLTLVVQGYIHTLSDYQVYLFHGTVDRMVNATKQDIDTQINEILSKITSLSENVESTGTNADVCLSTAQSDLEEFSNDLKNRLMECSGSMIMTGNDHLDSTWNRIWYEYDIDYQCSKMSFVQCSQYETEGCVDEVLSTINKATISLSKASQVLKADTSNQIPGMNFPCRQMILQELGIYPSLILTFVQTCLDSAIAGIYSFTC
jgi:thiamine phosphate synthase YjbQ (UPF0047 family)